MQIFSLTARQLKILHIVLTFMWIGIIPLALFTDLKNSVPFLVFISIYANVAGHWAAAQAARAEENSPDDPGSLA